MRLSGLTFAVTLTVAACGGPTDDDGEPEPDALSQVCTPETTSAQTESGYAVNFVAEPSPIPLNEPFELIVDVESDADLPDELAVEANAEMPQHGHGMNTIAYTEPDADLGGRFHVDGMQLHMPGAWKMYIDVIDDVPERLTFDVECIE